MNSEVKRRKQAIAEMKQRLQASLERMREHLDNVRTAKGVRRA